MPAFLNPLRRQESRSADDGLQGVAEQLPAPLGVLVGAQVDVQGELAQLPPAPSPASQETVA